MYDLIKYMDEYYEEKNRIAPFQPKFPGIYCDIVNQVSVEIIAFIAKLRKSTIGAGNWRLQRNVPRIRDPAKSWPSISYRGTAGRINGFLAC